MRITFHVALRAILLSFFLLTSVRLAYANGWEHSAIPFSALLEALRFEAPETRLRAAQSLGFRGQPEAVAPLLARLATPEDNPHVRGAIYAALGQLGDRRAVPALLACLRKEAREELRGDCAGAIGALGAPEALQSLLVLLADDASRLVQRRVLEALAGFTQAESVAALGQWSRHERPDMRRQAIAALGRVDSAAAVEPLLHALADARNDGERQITVAALAKHGADAAQAPLTRLLKNTENPRLRAQIAIALGAIRNDNAYPGLVALLHDPTPVVRFFAIRSLRELGQPEAVAPLTAQALAIEKRFRMQTNAQRLATPVQALADLSEAAVVLRALADLDAAKALPALLAAATALSEPPPPTSATALKLAEGEYEKRRAALYGLGYSRSQQAAELLLGRDGLADKDFRLRAVAVRSLGVLEAREAVPALIGMLDDPAGEVRWTAAMVLGRLGDSRAAAPLRQALADSVAETRRQAALALGFLADEQARAVLQERSRDDPVATVREAAAYALRLLGR